MTIVYKYPLNDRINYILVPAGSTFLRFGLDPSEMPAVWFHCDPAALGTDTYEFRLELTGQAFDLPNYIYRGTLVKGPIVVHAFSNR